MLRRYFGFVLRGPFLAAFLLTLSCWSLPSPPVDNQMDQSSRAILDYAHQKNLQFGPELAYTYGPLGFLIFPCFSTYAAKTQMAVEFALSFAAAAGVCLLAWRLRWVTRCAVLLAFAWSAANMPILTDFILEVGLFCWGLLCVLNAECRVQNAEWGTGGAGRWRLVVSICMFTALLVFSAQAKVSFFLTAIPVLGLMSVILALRSQRRLALGMVIGFSAGFLYCWTALGQAISNLGGFIVNSIAMIHGYDHALGFEEPEGVGWRGFTVAILLVLMFALWLARCCGFLETASPGTVEPPPPPHPPRCDGAPAPQVGGGEAGASPALRLATIPPLPRRGGEGRGEGAFELSIDGRAIQQALVNLIDNAIKHSLKGGRVTVGLERAECRVARESNPAASAPRQSTLDTPPSSLVTISVEDHGPGIPSEEHEKIFERFYRLGPELRRQTQGVGIGLSIVKHIVEAHGGRVLVQSAVGQGSRFTIELPLTKSESK